MRNVEENSNDAGVLCLEEEEARALVPGLVLPDNSVALFMPHGLNLHPRRYLEVEHHPQSFIGFFFLLALIFNVGLLSKGYCRCYRSVNLALPFLNCENCDFLDSYERYYCQCCRGDTIIFWIHMQICLDLATEKGHFAVKLLMQGNDDLTFHWMGLAGFVDGLPDICKESLKCGEPWDPGSVVETTYKHSF